MKCKLLHSHTVFCASLMVFSSATMAMSSDTEMFDSIPNQTMTQDISNQIDSNIKESNVIETSRGDMPRRGKRGFGKWEKKLNRMLQNSVTLGAITEDELRVFKADQNICKSKKETIQDKANNFFNANPSLKPEKPVRPSFEKNGKPSCEVIKEMKAHVDSMKAQRRDFLLNQGIATENEFQEIDACRAQTKDMMQKVKLFFEENPDKMPEKMRKKAEFMRSCQL